MVLPQETIIDLDIFGIQNPTQQGADILATQLGARVAMPDFFKGKPWELSKFPPPDRDEFLSWIGSTQWPQVEPILLKTIGFLREDGGKKFGLWFLSAILIVRYLWILLGRKDGCECDETCRCCCHRTSRFH